MTHQNLRLAAVLLSVGYLAVAAKPAFAASGPKWDGLYLGGSIGINGVTATETDTTTPPGSSVSFSGGPGWGPAGSVTLGYDTHLAPNVLAGVFSVLDITNASASLTSPGGDANRLQENFALSAGARLGALADRNTLLYVDGGYSLAGFTFTYDTAMLDSYSNGHMFQGWFAGVGLEHKITDALGLSLDYRFARYGSQAVGFFVPPAPAVETHEIQPDVQSIRVGVVYNFGN